MLNIQIFRNNPNVVREAMRRRHEDLDIERVIALDEELRSTIVKADELRARRNELSRQMGRNLGKLVRNIEQFEKHERAKLGNISEGNQESQDQPKNMPTTTLPFRNYADKQSKELRHQRLPGRKLQHAGLSGATTRIC